MKKRLIIAITVTLMSTASISAQASWFSEAWQDTKDAASSAWGSASDKTVELKDDAADSEVMDDVKKLGDADTYRKAWEGVKESARNPSEASKDEHGILD